MNIDRAVKILQFDKILENISKFAYSQKAKEDIFQIKPFQNKDFINELLTQVEEADKILFFHSISPSFYLDDISFAMEKAKVFSILSMNELLKIARVLRTSRNLQSSIMNIKDESIILLKNISSQIFIDSELEKDINQSILSETEMSDNASIELRNIRINIRRIGERIKTKLNSFVSSSSYSKYLQDNIVTVRGDRYVIPLKSEYRGSIPGLIHDQSASGSTIYLEPMAIIDLNNELKSAIIEESYEIERILKVFSIRISEEVEEINLSFQKIVQLDTIFAKAMYANSQNAIKPKINEKGYLYINCGNHPLIKKENVISNTIYIGKEFNMLFITGPNTGGKTVCLKMVGLFVIMALSGIFVPSKDADIGIFDNVFCDIGDEQSIEQNLSTFSSHINNIKDIINNITQNSLVLLDELGAGTDPTEGASLALSISEYLYNSKAKTIITTHYNELKEYAVVKKGIENASMEFNPNTYNPTFKLIIGTPGSSNALLIAEKLGMKKEIIEKAKEGIKGEKIEFENILHSLEKSKRNAMDFQEQTKRLNEEAMQLRNEAKKERDKLFLQRERLNESVKKETKKLVENAMEEANEIILSLRNLLDNPNESSIFEAHKLRKSLKKYIINSENEFEGITEEISGNIVVGDSVLIKSLNSEGKVVSINEQRNEATVKFGAISSKIKLNNLQRIKNKNINKKQKLIKTNLTLKNDKIENAINLIAKTGDEAIILLEEFVDQAVLGGINELRIIHGIGTGVLRKKVQEYLKQNKNILSFRDGQYGEGGKGVTIALLK